MSVLALFAAPSAATPSASEFLRLLSGLAACGDPPLFLVAGPGLGTFDATDLPDESHRYLDALSASGVVPTRATPVSLRAALRSTRSVLRLADPYRSGSPPLLIITDAWLSESSRTDAAVLDLVLSAGQVIRVPS